jgi:non-specific serine/threonine protein kinase
VQYLAQLLRHPRREILALDLLAQMFGGDPVSAESAGVPEPSQTVRRTEGTLGPVLDAPARRAYQARLAELRDELEQARRFNDLGRSETLQSEMDAVMAELRSAVGLGGRDRPQGSATERARLMVSKRIHATLKRITALHPPLGHHLNACVKTGYYCSYTPPPDEPVEWTL